MNMGRVPPPFWQNMLEPWLEKGCNPKPWQQKVNYCLDLDESRVQLRWHFLELNQLPILVFKKFLNLGRTSICELLSILTSSAYQYLLCSSFQCFSRMWSLSLISCRGPASHKWHGHCPSLWWSNVLLTQCSAEHLQTRDTAFKHNSDVRSHNLDQPTLFATSTIRGGLTTLNQLLLLVYTLVMAALIFLTPPPYSDRWSWS